MARPRPYEERRSSSDSSHGRRSTIGIVECPLGRLEEAERCFRGNGDKADYSDPYSTLGNLLRPEELFQIRSSCLRAASSCGPPRNNPPMRGFNLG